MNVRQTYPETFQVRPPITADVKGCLQNLFSTGRNRHDHTRWTILHVVLPCRLLNLPLTVPGLLQGWLMAKLLCILHLPQALVRILKRVDVCRCDSSPSLMERMKMTMCQRRLLNEPDNQRNGQKKIPGFPVVSIGYQISRNPETNHYLDNSFNHR